MTRSKPNSPSCFCGKCYGCRLFRVTYTEDFPTKKEYLDHVHQEEAREIIAADNKNNPEFIPYQFPPAIRFPAAPTRRELEVGTPICCNNEPMKLSQYSNDMWYCPTCRKAKLR